MTWMGYIVIALPLMFITAASVLLLFVADVAAHEFIAQRYDEERSPLIPYRAYL